MARSAARRTATALPEWIRPQLTKLVQEAPDGSEWLHEIKFDRYRMHARLDRGAVRLLTRTGLDWTQAMPTGWCSSRSRRVAAVARRLAARLLRDPDGRLVYAGRAGTGINTAELERLWRRLQPLATSTMPLDLPPPRTSRLGSPLVLSRVHKYPAIATAVSSIRARQAYLDGELCGLRPDGITSFSMIQAASDGIG
jgi:ATP-dependent DNA ligase